MSSYTILRQKAIVSPLEGQAIIRPKQQGARRVLISSLMLTSLIDAFSILVIFLLMNASADSQEMDVSKGMNLPMAATSDVLKDGPILRIERGVYFIEDQAVPVDQLAARLSELHERLKIEKGEEVNALIVQADKSEDFRILSPLLLAGSETGFTQFRFAVLQNEGAQ